MLGQLVVSVEKHQAIKTPKDMCKRGLNHTVCLANTLYNSKVQSGPYWHWAASLWKLRSQVSIQSQSQKIVTQLLPTISGTFFFLSSVLIVIKLKNIIVMPRNELHNTAPVFYGRPNATITMVFWWGCWSSRTHGFDSQHPKWSSQLSILQFQGIRH